MNYSIWAQFYQASLTANVIIKLASVCVCVEQSTLQYHGMMLLLPLHPLSLPQSKGGGLGKGFSEGEGGCHRQCSSPWCSGILQDCTSEAVNTILSTDSGIFLSALLSLYTVAHVYPLQ